MFYTNVNKDLLWDAYLNSFPENERQGHNCNTCRQFIKAIGGIIFLDKNNLVVQTLWDDVSTGNVDYDNAAKALASYVRTCTIQDKFIHEFKKIGHDSNKQTLPDGKIINWFHFSLELTRDHYNANPASLKANVRDKVQTYRRAVTELTPESVETVLELIADDNLYRGSEYLRMLKALQKAQQEFKNVDQSKSDAYFWIKAANVSDDSYLVATIRNSSIGSLLIDLSEPEATRKPLDKAVKSFEDKVSGTNYKRPKALFTQKQLQDMKKAIVDGGYESALERRLAKPEDLNVSDTLYVNRSVNKALNSVFDDLEEDVIVNPRKLNTEAITFDQLLAILPTAEKVEVLFENRLESSLMSLVTAVHDDAKPLFKWGNNFSWTYKDAITDSIKERVKEAGGSVDGLLRASLAWHNGDDLDLSIREPGGYVIYYGNKYSRKHNGNLDVDMNAGSITNPKDPVENIIYKSFDGLKKGDKFEIRVDNFSKRSNKNVGWTLQVEVDGTVFEFSEDHNDFATAVIATAVWNGETFEVKGNSKNVSEGKFAGTSKDIWGIGTNKFQKVHTIAKSPNYWGYNQGNEHVFFFIDGVKNDEKVRGIFNEFLNAELEKNYKRAFEALGNSIPVGSVDRELSGLGFSKTSGKEVIVRVTNKFQKVYKIKF